MQSDEDALKVAATFEEISIMDLEKELDADGNREYKGRIPGTISWLPKASALIRWRPA